MAQGRSCAATQEGSLYDPCSTTATTLNSENMSENISVKNKYKEGEKVYAKSDITRLLVVRRYHARIYYCRVHGDARHKDLVYFEKDLIAANDPGSFP